MPVFLAPALVWLAQKFGTWATERAWKAAAGVAFVGAWFVALGAIVAAVTLIPSPPASVVAALVIVAPSDWASQLAVVVAARVAGLAWSTFRQAYVIATS